MFANIFQPLIDVAEAILLFYHNTVGVGWGFSIVLLTVTVRLAILPLTFKQVRSMQAMQRLQPQMKELQKRYKDDKQRMNQELMKLYQEHQVNPLGSCLPLLLQFPFSFSLFYFQQTKAFAPFFPAPADRLAAWPAAANSATPRPRPAAGRFRSSPNLT